MKQILVVGSTGTLGREVVELYKRQGHKVTALSRSSFPAMNIEDNRAIEAFFQRGVFFDAVICTAGHGSWGKLTEMSEEKIIDGLKSKLISQIFLTQKALSWVNPKGVIILTGGLLAHRPMLNTWNLSTVNAALEGFVRAIQLELGAERRIVVVHPPMFKETAERLKIPSDILPSAKEIAKIYLDTFSGTISGEAIYVNGFEP